MPGLKLDARGRLRLTEADITGQIIGLLRAEGWQCIRLESELVTGRGGKPKRLGETGMPDWLIVRPIPGTRWLAHFYLELKAPGKKPRPAQRAWHDRMRAEGYLVATVDGTAALGEFLRANYWEKPLWEKPL